VRASQTRAVPSTAAARREPSGLYATLFTYPEWPLSSRRGAPVRASHACAFLPSAVARREPSGLNATGLPAPLSWSTRAPVRASHTRTVLSSKAAARRDPSGLYAAVGTTTR
jgi:hypothetical protein